MSGTKILDQIEIDLRNTETQQLHTIYIDIFDNSLSVKWLNAFKKIIDENYHLEKNYCFLGFPHSKRNAEFLLNQINQSIQAINLANIGYTIDDYFTVTNSINQDPIHPESESNGAVIHEKMNNLHRYFEELQGVSGHMSSYYVKSDPVTRWHIRQLNLLCHEFESYVLSWRKSIQAPEWVRPSQLMCWLNAPRFELSDEDLELFGIETINRPLGGVFAGVNKAVGKHHWEVFNDEGRDSKIDELTTTVMRGQTEAAADFDVEWANNPGDYIWQKMRLAEFRAWLLDNGFNPDDKSLTIGHPQIGQVDLQRSFNTTDYQKIWKILEQHLDVFNIRIGNLQAIYSYSWIDDNYKDMQIKILEGN